MLDALDVDERTRVWRDRLAHPGPADATTLVATAGGHVQGFASIGRARDDDAPPGTRELWALYVDPDRWRQGVGGALDRAVVADLVAAGAVRCTLWVLTGNVRARSFYERRGWTLEGATKVDVRSGGIGAGAVLEETRYERVLPTPPT